MSLQSTLSINLKALRKEQGLSQIELAEIVGTSGQYLSEIERGIVFPSVEMLDKLAHALKTMPTELLFDDDLMIYRLKKLLAQNKSK